MHILAYDMHNLANNMQKLKVTGIKKIKKEQQWKPGIQEDRVPKKSPWSGSQVIPTQQVKHDTHAYLHKQHVSSIVDSPVYGVWGQLYPPAAHRLQINVIAVLWIMTAVLSQLDTTNTQSLLNTIK